MINLNDNHFTVTESNRLYDIFDHLMNTYLDAGHDEVSTWSSMVEEAYHIIQTVQMRADGEQPEISRDGLFGILEIFEDEWNTVRRACQKANLPEENTVQILNDWVSLCTHELGNSYATYNVHCDILQENGLMEVE